jgi:hypothetical protein
MSSDQVVQTILAGREDGVPGNCVQAAVASYLEVPIDAVPHFLLWDDYLTCWRLRPSRAEAARPPHPSTRKGTTVNQCSR